MIKKRTMMNTIHLLRIKCYSIFGLSNYKSCIIKYYVINHDLIEQFEEENIEALHCKMVVMSSPPINLSPCEPINTLNTKTTPKGVIYNFLCQKDEVCDSFTHSFAILYVSLIKLCLLIDVYLVEIFPRNSLC